MNTRIASRTRAFGFTLIELLTVIAIIAILMALLFPVIGTVKETARKTQAKSDEMNIVAAVKAFNTEYGKYPNVDPTNTTAVTGDTLVGDMNTTTGMADKPKYDNNTLFDILRNLSNTSNANYQGNPRRIVFFEGKSVSNASAPKSGFVDNTTGASKTASKGGFYDPWGTEYFVYMDTDYDNQIDVSGNYNDFLKDSSPQVGVASFSFGKDRALGSPNASPAVSNKYKEGSNTSDDILSWQ